MTQKILVIDPLEFDSLLIQFKPPEPPVETIPVGAKLIDVSHHQGVIDWGKVRNVARVDYAMIRATNGIIADSRFLINWPEAKAAGIQRGSYAYWQNEVDAKRQAQAFIVAHGGDFGELPWALDLEDQQPPFTKAELSDVRLFMDMVFLQTGKSGLIYTGASVWNFPGTNWSDPEWDWVKANQLWFAAYNTTGYTPLAPWPHPCIWQHSSRGVIPGITANTVDLDTAGGGLTPIVPEWYWRGTTTERVDAAGKRPPSFFVKAKEATTNIYNAPRGQVIKENLAVSWRMTVQSVTADGWLKVHEVGAAEWWVKVAAVSLWA